MNYYTSTIPLPLAEKLKEKGMPMMPCFNITQTGSFSDDGGIHFYYLPTFASCLDWLMSEKDTEISFDHHFQSAIIAGTMETSHEYYAAHISRQSGGFICCVFGGTWHEAAEKAIEKALTLI